MDHYKLVLPEAMNAQGSLFGGQLLKWIDEFSYITACLEFPCHHFVTVSLDNVVFKKPIACGDILRFSVECSHIGRTSIRYVVHVYKAREKKAVLLFKTGITFVNISSTGKKKPIRACGASR